MALWQAQSFSAVKRFLELFGYLAELFGYLAQRCVWMYIQSL